MKPRLLFVAPRFPFPLYSGGERFIYALASRLSDEYEVTLAAFMKHGWEQAQTAFAMEMEGKAVARAVALPPVIVEDEEAPESFPYQAKTFCSREAARTIKRLTSENPPDVAQFHFLETAHLIEHLPAGVPAVLTEQDVSHFSGKGSYIREMQEEAPAGGTPEHERMRAYARAFYPRFKAHTVLCREDARVLEELFGIEDAVVTPTTIDVESFASEPSKPEGPPTVALVGHYAHYPNEDAAVYLCREIAPILRKELPDLQVLLVGSCPTPKVRELAGPGVTITGEVPDVRPYLRRASVFAAPVRLGGGTKGKVLEAFAMRLPVVGTPIVASGLDAPGEPPLLVGSDAAEFARKTLDLIRDEALRGRLTEAALSFVRSRHDHSTTIAAFSKLYRSLLTSSTAGKTR